MASTLVSPEVNTSWWLEGDQLGIVTTSATNGTLTAVGEDVVDGLLIHYEGEPDSRTDPEEFPDIENVFHAPLVDVVLAKLYREEAKNSTRRGNIEGAQMNRALSRDHQKDYDDKVKRLGVKKTDKTGGNRAVRPLNFGRN